MISFRVLKFLLCADDTCLSLVSNQLPNLMELVNIKVTYVDSWLLANCFTLNPSKTNYVVFKRDKSAVLPLGSSFTLGGEEVVGVTFFLSVSA